jgi:hypothetical protein
MARIWAAVNNSLIFRTPQVFISHNIQHDRLKFNHRTRFPKPEAAANALCNCPSRVKMVNTQQMEFASGEPDDEKDRSDHQAIQAG